MLRREIERRLMHWIGRVRSRLAIMREGTQHPMEFLNVMIEGVQVQIVVLGLLITIACGTVGYMLIEGWNLLDAFYMTMITLTTVGFGEIRELGQVGRIFTVVLIVAGFGMLTYGVSSAIEYVATGQVTARLEERRLRQRLNEMRNHFIVAGFGRVGYEVAAAFAQETVPFVIIDVRDDARELATELGYTFIQGSVTEDEVLIEAGIERARGLVACAGNDATNVYAVLTARVLNESLLIIARVTDDESEKKVRRAGANRVISPYVLSGRRMANIAVRPHVTDFLDITAATGGIEQTLEEVIIEDDSVIVNQTIGQIDLRRRTGANILALHLPNGDWVTNLTSATILEPGARLILLGNRDQLDVTRTLAQSVSKLKNGE